MSKSLIVTFHCVPNFGANLQAFALQKTLEKFLVDVEILDYRPKALTGEYKLLNTHSLKGFILSLYNVLPTWLRYKKFKRFQNRYYKLSPSQFKYLAKEFAIDSDYVFAGSDQIWNPRITGGYDGVYFGDFMAGKNCKKISYGASIGISSLTKEENYQLKALIKKLDDISVRENSAHQIISALTDKRVEVVLDPTLLLDIKEWDNIKINKNHGKYLLLYSISGHNETYEIAYKVSKMTGLNILEVSTKNFKPFSKKHHKIVRNAGPSEFLGLISSAEFVVTDSFHGTVFSLIYKKPFYTIPNKTKPSRMVELLSKLGLTDRLISDTNNFNYDPVIQYEKVNELLNIEKKKSIDFIKKAMNINNE
ncbi:MAG TPA: polysaccharide pyruvyl transferase family protein [Pseudobacteroides sp.]|uniref:polysaccharide pyruvyl transferase family protein n=1 Tax=Pseudobacteroides sp. TaxID=1968840 RepID=UPI002F93C44E